MDILEIIRLVENWQGLCSFLAPVTVYPGRMAHRPCFCGFLRVEEKTVVISYILGPRGGTIEQIVCFDFGKPVVADRLVGVHQAKFASSSEKLESLREHMRSGLDFEAAARRVIESIFEEASTNPESGRQLISRVELASMPAQLYDHGVVQGGLPGSRR